MRGLVFGVGLAVIVAAPALGQGLPPVPTPSLPALPTVVPSLPAPPALPAPTLPSAPSVPSVPSVPHLPSVAGRPVGARRRVAGRLEPARHADGRRRWRRVGRRGIRRREPQRRLRRGRFGPAGRRRQPGGVQWARQLQLCDGADGPAVGASARAGRGAARSAAALAGAAVRGVHRGAAALRAAGAHAAGRRRRRAAANAPARRAHAPGQHAAGASPRAPRDPPAARAGPRRALQR